MRAVVFEEVDRLGVIDAPDPTVDHPRDAIVRITLSAICGSDLHFLHGKASMRPGDGIGHEGVGIVEAVGPEVRRFRPGDRVVIAFDIACGECWFCERGLTGQCENFRNLGGGAFGGSLGGTQAELVRIPNADRNLLPVPDDLEDERALFVGDILTTGYYGTAIAGIRPGDTVAVVGAGPVGFFCIQSARLHGAGRVLALDRERERLSVAERVGAEAIDVTDADPQAAVREATDGRGADVVVDAVGSTPVYATTTRLVRRAGTISVVGMYVAERTEIPLGAYWRLAVRIVFAGICPVHAWWDRSMEAVRDGRIDPMPIISHRLPLDEAVKGYELFDSRVATKVVLVP